MPTKWISVLLLLLQINCYFRSGTCGKVVVWPMEYSHWLNLKVILEELAQRGHEVTVMRPSSSIFVDSNLSGFQFETFSVSINKNDMEKSFKNWANFWKYEFPRDSCLSYFPILEKMFMDYSDFCQDICKQAVLNKQLMEKMKDLKFDILLADAIGPCGELIAELLKIPFMYSLRFTPGYTMEKYSAGLLFPPSYIPMIMSGLSGEMTFMERVKNMICMVYFDFWLQTFNEKKWNQFYTEILGRPTTLAETMRKAEMWLIRSYWDLEFPHPTLPNVEYVGGLHCKPAKPLPKEMEEFVQSSGEHGIVVFCLGSVVTNITEKTEVIASALAQIPQKVLWKYEGKKPYNLGPNTQVYHWIPQNDLLGHPKTKAFITHGGTNSIYEAIYHGIPMVGIPLFGDQSDNIAHIAAKGAGIGLNLKRMSSSDLFNAITEVINNSVYKNNAMRLSTIHHDQPMKPLDRAVFWIEFVMRHKGAKHLRPLAHKLTWYQYHSLDVIGFLLACVAAIAFFAIKCCSVIYQNFVKMRNKKKNE